MKLRICLLVFCCLGIAWDLDGQSLTVIHASARCKDAATGKALADGQVVDARTRVDLGEATGKLVVWDQERGMLVMGARKTGEKQWQTVGIIKELEPVQPAITPYAEHFSSLADLQQHFSGRKYLLLGKSWLLADAPFRLGGDTVLFYKYVWVKADIDVSRKVERRADSLLLEPRFILDMNGKPVPAAEARNFQLYLLDRKTKGFSELARFEFVFADEEAVKREVGLLLGLHGAAQGRGSEENAAFRHAGQLDLVRQFLTAVYGSPDPHALRVWLDREFPSMD